MPTGLGLAFAASLFVLCQPGVLRVLFHEVASFYFNNKPHKSKERDQYSLNRLLPYFGQKSVFDIRRVQVRAYIQRRQSQGVTLSTIRRELRCACAAVNFTALELEIDLPNPFHALGIPEAPNRVRWLTKSEARRLIEAASLYAKTPLLPCFIRLALNTGCRRGELLGLEWRRVDLSRRLLHLEAGHTKAGKRRSVPLNAEAVAALQELRGWGREHWRGSPWVFPSAAGGHLRYFKTGFKNACQRAAISDFRIHDLRHTCASWLVMAGVDLYTVRDLLGHSSVTVTERYAHLAPAKVAAAVLLLEGPLPA